MFGKGALGRMLVGCYFVPALLLSLSAVAAQASAEEEGRIVETAQIPAGQGAVLQSSDGLVTAIAPAGIRAAESVLWYEHIESTSIPPTPGYVYVGDLFGLGLMYPDTFPIDVFARPVTVTYNYAGASLDGVDESRLVLAYFDGYNWIQWPSTVDTTLKQVTAQADHLMLTALLGRAASAVPAGSSVAGVVYYDRNGNAVRDGDDFPISTAGVRISSGQWSAFTTTASDGSYSFPGLGEGSYAVSLQVGDEWAFTTPGSMGGIAVTGQAGSIRSGVDFGMWYKLP